MRRILAAPALAAVVLVALLLVAAACTWLILGAEIASIAMLVVALLVLPGFFVVAPNESMALILLGRYVGTVRDAGVWWTNPFTIFYRETISLRLRNFQSERTKVNDASGNPIEIAAVVA